MGKKILIMSSTSEIAESLAHLYLNKSDTLLLHARNRDKLDALVANLRNIERNANLIRLPLMDLAHPNYATDTTSLALQYTKWFDDIVREYGLPNYIIIAAGGGSADMPDSGITLLNTVSAMLCCENYLRQVNEHIHNEKYNGKKFRLVYFGSMMADFRNDTYARAKWDMEMYMKKLARKHKNTQIHIQYAKIGPVDTKLLRKYIKRTSKMNSELGIISRMINWVQLKSIEMLQVTPEDVAKSIHRSIESDQNNFYAPMFMSYIAFLCAPFISFIRVISNM